MKKEMYQTYAMLIQGDHIYRYKVPSTAEEHINLIKNWTGLSIEASEEIYETKKAHDYILVVYVYEPEVFVTSKGVMIREIGPNEYGFRDIQVTDLVNLDRVTSVYNEEYCNAGQWVEDALSEWYDLDPPTNTLPTVVGDVWELEITGNGKLNAMVVNHQGRRAFRFSNGDLMSLVDDKIERAIPL